MNIAIECSRLHGIKTGLGYYVKNLVESLDRLNSSHHFFSLFSTPKVVGSSYEFWKRNISYHFLDESLAIYLRLNSALKKNKMNCFAHTAFVPPYPVCPCVTTLHDLYPIEHPEECPPRMAFWFSHFMRWVKNGSRHIITDSKFTADKVNKLLNVPLSKISVIPLGVNKCSVDLKKEKKIFFTGWGS